MQYNPEEYTEILNIFKAESEEIIQALNDGFLALEKNPEDKTPIKKLFQLSHSIKGAARMMGFNGIQDIAHKLEDILTYWEKDYVKINSSSFEIIYSICDFLSNAVSKSVEQGTDYIDDNLMNFLIKIDNYINETSIQGKENSAPNIKKINTKTSDENIQSKATDINALLLELMFILGKDISPEDADEVIMVANDDINQLKDIFEESNYIDIKNHIKEIQKTLSNHNKNAAIRHCIEQVSELKNKVYKEINVSTQNAKYKEQQIEEKNNIKISNKDSELDFDEILKNLPNIKTDKNNIDSIINTLNSICNKNLNDNCKKLITKIIGILNLIKNNNIIIDNDCYMLILQGIYLAKRLSFNKNDESNNLNFLIQRLNVIEQLFNINTTSNKPKQNEIAQVKSKEINDIDLINKNLNSFDLQEIKTLRVDTLKIDNLISQTGELLVNGIKTREHLLELSNINSKLIQWNSVSKKIITYLKYLEKKGFFAAELDSSFSMFYKKAQNFFFNNAEIVSELQKDFGELYNIISEDDNKLHQTAVEIEEIAKNIRILPLATIFHSFPRMIRDLANENNKKIDFIISGSDTTVDKKIIEEIKMPLIHILRNAVSHGIEIPHERRKNGKSEVGIIKLSAKQIDNNIVISIEDDGYGINLEKVKRIAIKKGMIYEDEINNISNEQLMKLLFLPGFSTNDSINEISGRGIGLDIVKTKINNLNGDIQIDSVLNKGCKVTIKLPLLISTIKVFIIMADNQKYAIPVSSIKYVQKIKKENIFNRNGQNCIIFDNHSVPIYSFSQIITQQNYELDDNQQYTVIIVENQKKQAAFITDKLIGDQEIFHKKLIPPIIKIKNISGFTTLSSGEICYILNPYELLKNISQNDQISHIDIKRISEKNEYSHFNHKKIAIFDDGEISTIITDIEKHYKETYIFNNINDIYDYLKNNEIDIFICKINYENSELIKLLQYIKNDEILSRIKIVIISDLSSFDVLNILNYFKPDLYVKLSEYNEEAFINSLKNKLQ